MNWRASIQSLLTWRKIRALLMALFLMILLIAFSIVALLSTQTGTQLSIAMINAATQSIHIQGPVHGRLIGPLSLGAIHFKQAGLNVEVNQLQLQWHPGQLWHGLVDIDKANVKSIRITSQTQQPKSKMDTRSSKDDDPSDDGMTILPAIRIQTMQIAHFNWQDESNDIHLEQLLVQADNDTSQQSFHIQVDDKRAKVILDGHFNPDDPHQWHMTATSDHLDLHVFSPSMHSDLNSKLSIESHDHERKIMIEHLHGSLNNVAVKGGGYITLGHPLNAIGKLWLDQGENRIELQTKPPEQFQWSIAIKRFNQLWPDMHGSIQSQGHIKTWHHQWNGDAKIDASNLVHNETTWVNELQAHIHMISKTMLHLQLFADRHGQTIHVDSTQSIDKNKQYGKIQRLAVALLPKHTWQVDAPIRWSHEGEHFIIQPFCMSLQKERICTELNWSNPTHLKFRLTTDQLRLHHFDPWLPPGSHLPGIVTINAHADQDGKDTPIDLHINADVSPGIWQWALPYGMRRIDMRGLHLALDTHDKTLDASIKAQIGQSQPLIASLRLPDFAWYHHPQQRIEGQLHWEGPLKSIPLPEIDFTQGRLDVNAQMSGTVAKPHYEGKISIDAAALSIPSVNTHWDKVNGMINMDNRNLAGHLDAVSDQGQVQIKLSGTPGPKQQGQLTVKGHQMPIAMTDDYKIWLNTDLTLKWQNDDLWLEGQIIIPKALLTPKDFSNTAQVSSDVVFAGQKKSVNVLDTLSSKLTITIGNDVLMKTHGVLGKLGGSVTIEQNKQAMDQAITTGIIKLTEGQFSIYGQSLQINYGSLIYDESPLDNPGLNIEASRTVNQTTPSNPGVPAVSSNSATDLSNQISQVTVGIRVTGTVEQPITTLYANPPGLSKSEILSYLVLGKGASQGDTSALLNAITTLGLEGNTSNNLSDQIKRDSGMPNIEITSTETVNQDNTTSQNYAVAIGRYISSKLYVSYSIGLMDPINIFKVTYLINKKWSLQLMNSILGSGIDLLYSI